MLGRSQKSKGIKRAIILHNEIFRCSKTTNYLNIEVNLSIVAMWPNTTTLNDSKQVLFFSKFSAQIRTSEVGYVFYSVLICYRNYAINIETMR